MMYLEQSSCQIEEFKTLVNDTLDKGDVPHADEVISNVPIYDMSALQDTLNSAAKRKALMAEWADVFLNRSGVVVLRRTYQDLSIVDDATLIYLNLIRDEKKNGANNADHFAKAGSNDRLWNSLQKLAHANPKAYVKYFGNSSLDAVCESWLGPNYQTTAQINLVYPTGKAQQPHRDYHLGFQTNEACEKYPAHVHALSPALTLQGAIAHCDMPVESGVTQFLPFSQRYLPGYLAYRQPEFQSFFNDNFVQVPLEKGDTAFFNPALFHAAGDNTSQDINRMANLVQISSAFGRSMENVDRAGMCRWVYPALQQSLATSSLTESERHAVIAMTAEGYPFPTNMDTDPPVGGLAPESQAELIKRCLAERLSPEAFGEALDKLLDKQRA